jgi:very-short-patch-repair endonuclease
VGRKVFDIYIPSLNLLIEVNGDYWHYNPELYDAEYFDESRGMYVKDKWANDKEKLVNAQAEGYNTIVLWQKNLVEDFESTITQTLQEFL